MMMKSSLLSLWLALLFAPLSLSAYEYSIRWLPPNTHTLQIDLKMEAESGQHTDLHQPAWRPGRYYLQDYSASLSHFEVADGNGKPLRWEKLDKDTWRVYHPGSPFLSISYQFLANNPDAGSSYYVADQVFLNPINFSLFVEGRMDEPVRVSFPDVPADWEIATALPTIDKGRYAASSFDEWVDSPVILAAKLHQLQFAIDGVDFYVHFQGDYQGNAKTDEAFLEALDKMCREQAAIFGGFPFESYHFLYRLMPYRLRHAVEHTNSASFALPAANTATPKGIVNSFAAITSHELWHAWNVKRIRPAALWPYDYTQEQYTSLHWFTEGVTDYYAHLILIRAGVRSEDQFWQVMSRVCSNLSYDYAASVVSPAQASFDSWLSSSPYAHPNHQISYYGLGQRLGLFIDAELLAQTKGEKCLDDVFRYLYQTHYQEGQGVPEDGIQKALEVVSGESWADFFTKYVTGTEGLPYEELLAPIGVEVSQKQDGNVWQRLGIQRGEWITQGYLIRQVKPGSDAYVAGFGEGDLILEVDGTPVRDQEETEIMRGWKSGKVYQIRTLTNFQVQNRKLKVTQSFAPTSWQFSPASSAKPKAKQWYDGWIRSRQ
ncbi:MAG: PDZ domain-containing protein [Bacteroidota bacterium]